MPSQSIEVRSLTPTIGAEIFGVDLGGDLTNEQFATVHDALVKHVVIFFRDQKMTPEQHKQFGRRFGKLHIHPASPNLLEGHPEILLIKADENSKRVAGEVWHSDVSCDAEPPMGSILYMHETPENGGGDTMFANMYTAYERLSAPMQRFLETLTAVHDGEHVYRGRFGWKQEPGKTFPRSEHPVVRTHPEFRTQGALRQSWLHHLHRRPQSDRKRRPARHALPAYRNARLSVPLQMAPGLSRVLG